MAAHDTGWEIFRIELKRWMEMRRFTNKALAEAINANLPDSGLTAPVDEQIIKRWRHSTSPPLMTLKVIARVLGMSSDPSGRAAYDPTYLPRSMGILDAAPENTELIEAAYRLQTIRAKITEAQSSLASLTADEGAVSIVRAATAAGLGAAVLPVYEGPRGYPMHVSDRIDLRDPDVATGAPDPADHPLLADALRDAFAVRSNRYPRFSAEKPPAAGVGVGESPMFSPWAVQHLGCPRTSAVHRAHVGLPAVAITSMTITPWPDDIGNLVAMVLGYGFTTTRELARELVDDPDSAQQLRGDIHDSFLFESPPQRRVWTHHSIALPAGNDHTPFRDGSGNVANQLVQFYLREDDAMLHHAAGYAGGDRTPIPANVAAENYERLLAMRDEVDRRFTAHGENPRLRRIDVAFTPHPEDRWTQVFDVTLAILKALDGLGVQAQLEELHERLARNEPQVAPQVLRWLADHDSPYVDKHYRTAR